SGETKILCSRFWIERRARIIRKVQPARRCREDRLSMVANQSERPTEMKAEFAQVQPSSGNQPAHAPRENRVSLKSLFIPGLLVLIAASFFVVRPYSHRSPTVDILGSYFPAWMVCIVSGLTLTVVSRWIIWTFHLEPYASPAPLIYSCLTLI